AVREAIHNWKADLVIILPTKKELRRRRQDAIGSDPTIISVYFPVAYEGTPLHGTLAWQTLAEHIQAKIHEGAKVLLLDLGNTDRARMVASRILRQLGENPKSAFMDEESFQAWRRYMQRQYRWAILE